MKTSKTSSFIIYTRIIIFIVFYGALFALLSYHTLSSMTEFKYDIIDFLKTLIYNEQNKIEFISKITILLKLLNIFLLFLLVLFSFSMFSSGLTGFFYPVLAEKYGYEKNSLKKTIKKITEWQIYKNLNILFPFLGFIFIFSFLIFIGTIFFNTFISVLGANTGLIFFTLSFTGFNLMFFLSLVIIFTIRKIINSGFGAEIAVSEPEIQNNAIFLRSKKFIYSEKSNFFLISVYGLFLILILIQVKNLNLLDLKVFSTFFAFNCISYTGLKYIKTRAYIKSLLNYYEKKL